MPTLGFLKKKRTKDSQGNIDLNSPASPIKETGSPITPTLSKSSTGESGGGLTRVTSAGQTSNTNNTSTSSAPAVQKPADSMQAHYQQQSYPAQQSHQNAASINNIIHPNNPNDSAYASNGSTGAKAPFQQPVANPVRETKGKYTLNDFTIQRTLGTGSFGRVHLVQSKHNQRFYAVKVLKKAQVVKMKQVEHTNDERRMLQKVKHPFLITLWGTFQDSKNLYMVMDFIEGGELFSLLRKSQVSHL